MYASARTVRANNRRIPPASRDDLDSTLGSESSSLSSVSVTSSIYDWLLRTRMGAATTHIETGATCCPTTRPSRTASTATITSGGS